MAMITTRADGGSSINLPSATYWNGHEFWFNWIQTLVMALFVHRGSGTGTAGTFQAPTGADNTNNQITNSGTIAGGLNRNNAWIVIEDPGGGRQWMLQRGTTNTTWRMYYSAAAKFTGTGFGAISATVPPSAADQVQVIGTAGAYANFSFASATCALHCIAYSDPDANGVYSWFLFGTQANTGYGHANNYCFLIFSDGLRQAHASDPDKSFMYPYGATPDSGVYSNFYSNVPKLGAWYRLGEADQAWIQCGFSILSQSLSNANLIGGTGAGCAPDFADVSETMGDVLVMRGSTNMATNQLVKGISNRVKYRGAYYRDAGVLDIDGTGPGTHLYFGAVLLPWPTGTQLVSV